MRMMEADPEYFQRKRVNESQGFQRVLHVCEYAAHLHYWCYCFPKMRRNGDGDRGPVLDLPFSKPAEVNVVVVVVDENENEVVKRTVSRWLWWNLSGWWWSKKKKNK